MTTDLVAITISTAKESIQLLINQAQNVSNYKIKTRLINYWFQHQCQLLSYWLIDYWFDHK